MKTLLIMRHAKSSWDETDTPDHDRPLNKRGKRDAPRMGRLLREQNLAPDFILSSSAKRAHKTAEAVADQCGSQPEIKRCRELYTIDADAYLDLLHDLPDTYQRVMIVGHNPVCEEFLHLLTGEEVSLPTAAVACVQLPIQSWEEINSETNGQGLQVWCPRELP